MVPTYCVVPFGDGEGSTSVSIPGFVDAKGKAKKPFASQKVERLFLESHKKLYMELHQDFSKIEYAPQSEASLQNFQTLVMMEIALLMGCDVDWKTASTGSAANASGVGGANAGGAVLSPAAGNDDCDISSESGADAAAPAIDPPAAAAAAAAGIDPAAASARTPAAAAAIDPAATAAAAGIDPAEAAAAAAYAAAADAGIEAMPDVDDFTTWKPGTCGAVDYDKIPIPTDPMLSVCSV